MNRTSTARYVICVDLLNVGDEGDCESEWPLTDYTLACM
jgi:hypothetical protein